MREQWAHLEVDGELLRKFSFFLCIGGGITAAHYVVLITTVSLLGVDPVLASTTGYGVASLINYYLNSRITFKYEKSHGIALMKFLVVAAVGLVFNAVMMSACMDYLSLHYLVAQMVATVTVLVWNFFGNYAWSFR